MAANWIKVEVITPDKPEIFRLAEILKIDPDAVLGKAIRFWVWADQQTIDGNANSVTKNAIDRVAFMSGFADALITVGWLHESNGSLTLPNFDRHNGESSKKRALTNRRVSEHRKQKPKSNAKSVTEGDQKALPEEEEEEEEDKELKDPPLNPPKGKSSGNKFDPLSVELPEWLSPELWAEWVAYRKQLGKPIKTQQGVSGSINKLATYREQGHSPEYVVGLTMSNEWRGLLVPDGVASKPRRDVNVISQPDKKVPDGFRG